MIEVGRLCMKIAGRDAGEKCVVVDIIDNCNVLIDGQTRRRKCNIKHLEPIEKVLKIKKGISHADIVKEFKKLGLEARETEPKKAGPKPKKQIKKKVVEETAEKTEKKVESKSKEAETKKEVKKTEKPTAKKEILKKPAAKSAKK